MIFQYPRDHDEPEGDIEDEPVEDDGNDETYQGYNNIRQVKLFNFCIA